MRVMQTGEQPNTTLLWLGNSGGFAPGVPPILGWRSMLADGRDLAAELVEKVSAFRAPGTAELQPAPLVAAD